MRPIFLLFEKFSKGSLSVRSKLLAILLGLVVTSLVLTNILWIPSAREVLSERIIQSHENIARNAGDKVSDFINIKIRSLILRSQSASFIRRDLSAAQFDMTLMLKQDGDLREISFMDENGQELIKITPNQVFPQEELTNQASSDKFKISTFRYGIEYIGPTYFSPENEPTITIAVPIVVPIETQNLEEITTAEISLGSRKVGDILGLLSTEINLTDLLRSVSSIEVGESGYIYIIDGTGRLIAHPNQNFIKEGFNVTNASINQEHFKIDRTIFESGRIHTIGEIVTIEGKSETGDSVLATHYHISLLNWGLVVQEPLASAFSSLTPIWVFAFLLSLVGIIMTAFVSTKISKILTKTLNNLSKGAQIIGSGNLSHRIPIQSKDEIGELAHTFNTMAENLQKREHELFKERENTKTIITNFTDGLILFDKAGKTILVNPQTEKFLKINVENILGVSVNNFIENIPKTHRKIVDVIFNSKENTLKKINKKKVVITDDLTLSVSTLSLKKESETQGTLLILHDITQEDRVEKLKSEFVTITAHALRTPLSAIRWSLKSLAEGEVGKVNKEQKTLLLHTADANTQLINLVGDLLNITKIEEGKLIYKLELTDIVELIDSIIKKESELIIKRKIKITFEKPQGEFPKTMLDQWTIQLVVQNLIENAVHYTLEGGSVVVKTYKKDNNIYVSITDTGIGIPDKEKKRIFTKFFRGEDITNIAPDGSGLGLFMAKNIIESHKGKIWFESMVDKGSTFTFSIPIIAKISEK